MTTITRERLKQIYAECEERDPAIFEIRELVRIALASLEAEPEPEPEPEPVVPESISVRQAISALESADCVTTIGQAYKMGWNACRSAMLSQLSQQERR